jgi:hypothetical protein
MRTDGVVAVGGPEHLFHALGSERGLAGDNVGLLCVEATKARLRLRRPNSSKARAMAGAVPRGSPGSGGEGEAAVIRGFGGLTKSKPPVSDDTSSSIAP